MVTAENVVAGAVAANESVSEREARLYMHTFRRQPLVLVRGDGPWVWDDQNKRYLDLVAGIAVNVLGYNHPAVTMALTTQGGLLTHVSNLFYSLPQLELAELLVANSCADRVFFTNSGAESNEGAIKIARKFGKRYRDGAYEIVTMKGSFHGRTLATVAATAQPKYQAPFTPMPEGFRHVAFNNLPALRAAIGAQTAAVLLEPVQGESGVHPATEAYMREVRALCDEHNILMMVDEVQTGMGRTGTFFAYQGYGIEPDVITVAKGLCGGLPGGAVLARGKADVFEPGDHGSTMGGNPLVCAVGVATVQTILGENLPAHAVAMGAYMQSGLQRLRDAGAGIADIRVRGLMIGIDLTDENAAAVVAGARERGVLFNNTGPRTLRMVPPLIVDTSHLDLTLAVLEQVLADVHAKETAAV